MVNQDRVNYVLSGISRDGDSSVWDIGDHMRMFRKETPQFGADDVKATQDVVSEITAALKTGAEQQDIAAKRLNSLTKAMGKMDANVRQSARLQAEVGRLETETKSLKIDLDKKRAWAQEQSAKLASVQKERDRLRSELEGAKSEISARSERESGLRESEMKLTREVEVRTRELNQRTDRLEDLALTQQRLQEELAEANSAVSTKNHKCRELQNTAEELTLRLSEKTKSADASLSALRDLRLDHHAVKEQFVSANSRLQSTEYEQSSQKTLFEDALKRRADEILALKTQIEQLTTQLRIKDTMGSHFDDETAGLRQALETERERNAVNEQRLRNQAETEARQSRALGKAKSEFDLLSAKFVDAMKDLDSSRQFNRVQSQKLENYAQLNNVPAPKREYRPVDRPVERSEDLTLLKVIK